MHCRLNCLNNSHMPAHETCLWAGFFYTKLKWGDVFIESRFQVFGMFTEHTMVALFWYE